MRSRVRFPGLENALQYLPINVGLGVTFILDDTRRPLSLAEGLHDQRGLGNAVAYPCLHCGRQFPRVVGYRLQLLQIFVLKSAYEAKLRCSSTVAPS